ncbi:MAG: DUF72 domain-containing protein [Staphylothermus sp.]|nr:DUF72 domain-containing protein [Staphylothermus sp.]
MKIIKIGCCGFPVSRKKYFQEYTVVELQNTFYNIPTKDWAEKIRSEAPENFEFTLKAWQVITHPHRSPTWKKLKEKPPGNLENYGWLKPTKENIEALRKTLEVAAILKSNIIVLQTPPSLPCNNDSFEWINKFFEETKTLTEDKYIIGWEPRGEWTKRTDLLEKILVKNNILHIVDPYRTDPLIIVHDTIYYRLHGIGEGEVNYRYKYTDEDHEKLVEKLLSQEYSTAYIMYNNIYMHQDSKRLKEILSNKQGIQVL